jgi:hypothetical protein
MFNRKFAAFLVLGLLGYPHHPTVSSSGQSRGSDDTAEPRIALGIALSELSKSCRCFFTIEEGWKDGESVNSMEAALVPERVLRQSPQQVMDAMRITVPNFAYEPDKLDSRIIHIKDKRLASIKHYALDQVVGPFEFHGELRGLIEAIAKLKVPITAETQFGFDESADLYSHIDVKGASMQVRAALTNFIPLDRKPNPSSDFRAFHTNSKILWIARTALDNNEARTRIHFL